MGEGISKSIVQGNNNSNNQNNESTNESNAEEQQMEHNPGSNNANSTEEGMAMSSGRVSHAPAQLIEEMGEVAITAVEQNYYFALQELHDEKDEYGCVGAGIGMGINNTHELKVLDYDGATTSNDSDKWEESVAQEHE